jgi:hypothetical protein
MLWALGRLQLRPPDAWLLRVCGASQQRLAQFTHAQLAGLAVGMERVLQLPQQQQQAQGEQQGGSDAAAGASSSQRPPRQPAMGVPPAVWQLQLELQLRQRTRQQRSRIQDSTAAGGKEASTQEDGGDRSLAVLAAVLARWRRASAATVSLAEEQQP